MAQSQVLNSRFAFFTKVLPDGRVIDVVPLTLGRARLLFSEDIASSTVDDCW